MTNLKVLQSEFNPMEALAAEQTQAGVNLEVKSVVGKQINEPTELDVASNNERPSRQTLGQFLADLEAKSEDGPETMNRLRQIEMILMFIAAKTNVTPEHLKNHVWLTPLPGMQTGEASMSDGVAYIDPVALDKVSLEDFRYYLLHEMVHLSKKLNENAEGLVEFGTSMMTGRNAKDYLDLVRNTETIVENLGEGDKERGFDRAAELFSAEKFDDLSDEFKTKFDQRNPGKAAADPDCAYKLFQLAFPYLHNEEGEFREDAETIQDESTGFAIAA